MSAATRCFRSGRSNAGRSLERRSPHRQAGFCLCPGCRGPNRCWLFVWSSTASWLAAVTIKTRLAPMARTGELTRSLSRNSSWELGYGERRCGFNTKLRSTTVRGLRRGFQPKIYFFIEFACTSNPKIDTTRVNGSCSKAQSVGGLVGRERSDLAEPAGKKTGGSRCVN